MIKQKQCFKNGKTMKNANRSYVFEISVTFVTDYNMYLQENSML